MEFMCRPEPVGLKMVRLDTSRAINFDSSLCDIYPKDEFGDSPRDFVFAKLDAPPQETSSRTRTRAKKKKEQQQTPTGVATPARPPATKTNGPEGKILPTKNFKEARSFNSKSGSTSAQTQNNKMGISEWPMGYTTAMLRNIPVRYTAEELLADFSECGFEGTYDFFYLPMDFHNKRNRGYGFVNFRSVELALKFVGVFDRRQLTRYSTQKILEVSPANTQGFEENVNHYARRDAQRVQNIWFKPMIF